MQWKGCDSKIFKLNFTCTITALLRTYEIKLVDQFAGDELERAVQLCGVGIRKATSSVQFIHFPKRAICPPSQSTVISITVICNK